MKLTSKIIELDICCKTGEAEPKWASITFKKEPDLQTQGNAAKERKQCPLTSASYASRNADPTSWLHSGSPKSHSKNLIQMIR